MPWSISISSQQPQPVQPPLDVTQLTLAQRVQLWGDAPTAASPAGTTGLYKAFTTQDVLDAHEAWHVANGPGGIGNKIIQFQGRPVQAGEHFLRAHQDMEVGDGMMSYLKFLHDHGWTGAQPVYLPNTDVPLECKDPEPSTPIATRNPHIDVPVWLSDQGGNVPAPGLAPGRQVFKLSDFQTMDELGRAIGAKWHGSVHNTIGGVFASFRSPEFEIFGPWHNLIDSYRAKWLTTPNGQKWLKANPGGDQPIPMMKMPMHMVGAQQRGMGAMAPVDHDFASVFATIQQLRKLDPVALNKILSTREFNDDGSPVDPAPVRKALEDALAAAKQRTTSGA
jgi:hypothetical protein